MSNRVTQSSVARPPQVTQSVRPMVNLSRMLVRTGLVMLALTNAQAIAAGGEPPLCRDHGNRARLKERVNAFYLAAREARWDDVYLMVAPPVKRDEGTYEAFLEKFKRLVPNVGTSVRLGSIECDEGFGPNEADYPAVAEVALDVTHDLPDGTRRRYKNLYSRWALIAGEWFWLFDSSDSCDRPNFGLQPTVDAPSSRASCAIRMLRVAGG